MERLLGETGLEGALDGTQGLGHVGTWFAGKALINLPILARISGVTVCNQRAGPKLGHWPETGSDATATMNLNQR